MIKLVVLYGHPDDPAAFDDYYESTHLPLADKMPYVRRAEIAKALPGPDGSRPPFYRVTEVYYDSLEDLQASNESPEGEATRADVENYATGGVTIFVADVLDRQAPGGR